MRAIACVVIPACGARNTMGGADLTVYMYYVRVQEVHYRQSGVPSAIVSNGSSAEGKEVQMEGVQPRLLWFRVGEEGRRAGLTGI